LVLETFIPQRSLYVNILMKHYTRYNSGRGFGFIKDENDGAEVFFHISRVKNRIEPAPGLCVKFLRELGEKGPQAGKVWAVSER
jgi:cold shock CspA family protein